MFHPFSLQIDSSPFELRMGKTSPETIVFKVDELPYLEVTDNMKNDIDFVFVKGSPVKAKKNKNKQNCVCLRPHIMF